MNTELPEADRDQNAPDGLSVLTRMQRGMEELYRVTTNLDVQCFVVDEQARDHVMGQAPSGSPPARRPREQLLINHDGDEVHLGLFLGHEVIATLERHDPARGLFDKNFWHFCLAVEGISHFIYVALCAADDRRVTALELELQAEVDKFVACLLVHDDHTQHADLLRRQLFEDTRLADDLSDDERDRYRTAHESAHAYVTSLDRRYLRSGRTVDMLNELRRFYRMGLPAKLEHIGQAA